MDRIIVNFISGARTGHTEVYPLIRFTSLYLGRGPKCDVRVDADKDTMVSRSHAVIEWIDPEEGERSYTLTDLLSSNGTYLNGERVIGTVALATGDYVRLGLNGPEFLLTVEQPAEDEQPSVTQSLRLDKLRLTPPAVADTAATVRAGSMHDLASSIEPQTQPGSPGLLRRK